ncbi:MAG TPA: pyrroline-5-carboxylate reductase [Candidatus Sulfotelmatobacter sp.]|nr:pyrroline-5-carboxylate reductase [Candidatus Sulfotelmatobacter sp.]
MLASAAVLLVGCGKMGGAMIAGWRERGLTRAVVVEPAGAAVAALRLPPGMRVVEDAAAVPADFAPDMVVLAVKPQAMDDVAPRYRRFADAGVQILSIAAGKTLDYFAARLGAGAPVIRVMPNLPASIGRGISVAVANPHTGGTGRDLAEALLAACGEVAWVDDEALLDAVTALSGGGPAYVFLLVELLARAGIECGLPPALAQRLARVTVAGSGELIRQSTEAVETLRQNVTSPGGTTLEALKILMADDGLQPIVTRALQAATRRSRDLSK